MERMLGVSNEQQGGQCVWAEESSIQWARSCRALQANGRNLTFTMDELINHWRDLSRQLTWSKVYFYRTVIVLVLKIILHPAIVL